MEIHVMPEGSLWKLERDGVPLRGTHGSQADAVAAARAIGGSEELTLVVHRRDGQRSDVDHG